MHFYCLRMSIIWNLVCIKFGSGKFIIYLDPIHKQFQTANSNNVYPNVLHIYLVCSFIVCFLWTKLRIRSFRICHWIRRTAKQLALLISNCSNQFRSFVCYSYCSLDPTTNYETKNSSSIDKTMKANKLLIISVCRFKSQPY